MKLLVTSPQGRTSLIDFSDLLRTRKALEEFCEANEDDVGTYDYDACQGSHEDDVAMSADTVVEQIKELLEKPAIPKEIAELDLTAATNILEAYGFACHDSESLEDLHEAIRVNIEDGTIPREEVAVG